MSFSSDTREELCRLPLEKPCCMLAELSALYQSTGSLKLLGRGQMSVQLDTESAAVARRIFILLSKRLSITAQVQSVLHARLGGKRRFVLILSPAQTTTFLMALGLMDIGPHGAPTLHSIAPKVPLSRVCCQRAFLRGAMLGAGTMTAPESGYHLSITAQSEPLQNAIAKCLQRFDLPIKRTVRRGMVVFYMKSGEQIITLLTQLGAHQAVIAMQDKRVTKQVMQGVNRAMNCDAGNLRKQMNASDRQIEAIGRLISTGAYQSMPPALQQIAKLRIEHPDLSTEELGALIEPPLGKSGVNHRLSRMMTYDTNRGEQHPKEE